jgi:hypothetical protein
VVKAKKVKPEKLKFVLQIREQSEVIWRDNICGIALRLALGFLVISLLTLTWFFRKLPAQVPLFYSRPWGEAQLVSPLWLSLLPLITLVVLVINTLIGGLLFTTDKLLSRILLATSALGGFLSSFSLIRIVLLII